MANRALCIGINEYVFNPLGYAVADARSMAKALSESPYQFETEVLLDSHAKRSEILKQVDRVMAGPKGTKLLFMAGHAAIPHGIGGVFASYGASDWAEMPSFADIAAVIHSHLSSQDGVVIILDCCAAGSFQLNTSLTSDQLHDAAKKRLVRANVAVMTACSAAAVARESRDLKHGAFTYHLLQGLSGASAESDGSVTVPSLFAYAARRLEEMSYPRPGFKSDLTGRAVLGKSAEYVSPENKREHSRRSEIASLSALLDTVSEQMAEQRHPFLTRDEYRAFGWLRCTKLVQPVAAKKVSIEHKYHADLRRDAEWQVLVGDVHSLIKQVSTPSVGTYTEFGPIVGQLGNGGFGTVHKIEDGVNTFAYKIFHPQDLGNASKEERFRIGYRAMDLLAHPRIVRVVKFVESPLSFYMNFIDGQNLRRWQWAEESSSELVRILLGICETVEYAHGRNVIHRDIKPENIIMSWNQVRARWEPVLTDFDLAWFDTATSHTIEAFGAPFYAAPEQLHSPGESITHQQTVDVFSMAMIGLYVLTRKDPASLSESFDGLRVATRDWPKSARDGCEQLLAHASQRDPGERVQSVSEFRSRLQHVYRDLISSEAAAGNQKITSADDFVRAVSLLLDRAHSWDADGTVRMSSASGRTSICLRFEGKTIHADFLKGDRFTAQGLSHDVARATLKRRLDARLAEMHTGGAAQIRRVGSGSGGEFSVRVDCRFVDMDYALVRVVSDMVTDVGALFDQF